MGGRSRTTAIAAAIALLSLATGAIEAPAAGAAVGYPGPSYLGGGSPTGSKPQSKAWFAGGRWWASMVDAGGTHRIHALDRDAHTWSSTGVALDARSSARDDVLYDEAAASCTSPRTSSPERRRVDRRRPVTGPACSTASPSMQRPAATRWTPATR